MGTTAQPSFYLPHGGGPCFFMDDPQGHWAAMEAFLRALPGTLPAKPSAIIVVSGHWETQGFALTSSERPSLLFDYYGFPPHISTRSDQPGEGRWILAAENLRRYAAGEKMLSVVDLDQGY